MEKVEQSPTDLTGVLFSDPLWLQTFPLNRMTVLDYFALSPFYDPACNNEKLKAQGEDLSLLVTLPYGTEYVVVSAQEPNVYVIRKQLRVTPDKMVPLAAYYVLDGSIYQAPHLQAVLGSRAERCLYYVQSGFGKAAMKLKEHLREEDDTATSRESPAPEAEPVDRAEAFHMDQIITSVFAKLPPPNADSGQSDPSKPDNAGVTTPSVEGAAAGPAS